MKHYKYIEAYEIEKYDGWDVEGIFPAVTEEMVDYVIVSKTDTPIQDYIKLHEATTNQILEELRKRLENK